MLAGCWFEQVAFATPEYRLATARILRLGFVCRMAILSYGLTLVFEWASCLTQGFDAGICFFEKWYFLSSLHWFAYLFFMISQRPSSPV